MIRIAAAGDLHYDLGSEGKLTHHLEDLKGRADFLLLAGDLTQTGHPEEARVLAKDLASSPVPVVAVLGNHDYHLDQVQTLTEILESGGGVHILERKSMTIDVNGSVVGIVGLKGFCGGFIGGCGSDFGEPEMRSFIQVTKQDAAILKDCLSSLNSNYKIVLMHYSPTPDTLLGERHEIYPFLGSYLLAQAIDEAGADLVFHGHAHRGIEKGFTAGGIPVRNVAQPVIRHAFNVYNI